MSPPALTPARRLGRGPVLRAGSKAPYHALAELPGEPHKVRSELVHASAGSGSGRSGRAIACFAHLTDLHLADVQSPARFEFMNREHADPRFRLLLPMHRPQEALNAHALDAMVRTLNGIERGPLGGAPLELVVLSGDAIDNAQANELATFLAVIGGGVARPGSGGPRYEGVQSAAWPEDGFWRPGSPSEEDAMQSGYGYPQLTGLLERALQTFPVAGLRVPWIGCQGNHELLLQGIGILTPAIAAALVGTRKSVALPAGVDRYTAAEDFVSGPEAFLAGPAIVVTADAGRRPLSTADFLRAHPQGHGFTVDNVRRGTAYFVHDTPAVRFIVLATACPGGGAEGRLDAIQAGWLEARLAEVRDRLVVIVSHHGLDQLANHRDGGGSPHLPPAEVLALLLRFPTVVLWLNGHTHATRVRPRPSAAGGLWEVTTCSLVDWPSQARLVELLDRGEGVLEIACTMVDHASPTNPEAGETGADLAGLHRQLAANQPRGGFGLKLEGTPLDRNVVLRLPAPFPLRGAG